MEGRKATRTMDWRLYNKKGHHPHPAPAPGFPPRPRRGSSSRAGAFHFWVLLTESEPGAAFAFPVVQSPAFPV